jgi:nickel/cobalt transporter (NicO) family protein
MGTFSISVYSRLEVGVDEIQLRWVMDMAEAPSAATVKLIDADGSGSVSEAEKNEYFQLWSISIVDAIDLSVDGRDLPLQVTAYDLALPSGEGGSPALRVTMDLTAELPPRRQGRDLVAHYRDMNYTDYIGWREVVVRAGEGVALLDSSAPTEDRTNELRTYPSDLWATPPNSEATFTIHLFDPAASAAPATGSASGTSGTPPQPVSGFQVWPTGVLAALVIGLIVAWGVVEARGDRPRRR